MRNDFYFSKTARLLSSAAMVIFCLFFSFEKIQAQFAINYADSTQLLLVFSNELDTASINQLRDTLNAVEIGVSPLTRVHLWQIPPSTLAAFGGPIGVQNHSLGKTRVQGGDLNFGLFNPDNYQDSGTDCYGNVFTCVPDTHRITAAIMDTGIDGILNGNPWTTHPAHPRFSIPNRIWQNTSEPGPVNGLDEDGNWYADDKKGWDFVSEDMFPLDSNSHGTHVAGIMAQLMNNNNANPNARLMIAQTQDNNGYGSLWDLVMATDYALLKGAKVFNWSLSYTSVVNSVGKPHVLEYVMDFAKSYNCALFVAAAGNDGLNIDSTFTAATPSGPVPVEICPAKFGNSNLFVVASGTCTNGLSVFSNYGTTSVDITAPGQNILSTIPFGAYGIKSGTSMAAPFVAANAVLMGSRSPNFHWKSIKSQMMQFSLTSAPLVPKTVSGKMLNFCDAYPTALPLSAIIKAGPVLCLGGNTTLTAVPAHGVPPYSFQWSTGAVSPIITTNSPGIYSVTITDNVGATSVESTTLYAISQPPLVIQPDTISCSSPAATLNIPNPNWGASYLWSNGMTDTTISVSPTTTTTYTVTATLASGCTTVGLGKVVVANSISISAPATLNVCVGSCVTVLPSVTGGIAPYVYSWSNGTSTLEQTFCPPVTTEYWITVSDALGCTATKRVRIIVRKNPLIAPIASQDICPCGTAIINAPTSRGVAPYTFLWNPGGLTGNPVSVSPTTTTTYSVTATDVYGCTGTRTARVRLVCQTPVTASAIINTATNKATVTWIPSCEVIRYQVQWRCSSSAAWISRSVTDPLATSTVITLPTGGCPNFEWRIRSQCCDGGYSAYSPIAVPFSSPFAAIDRRDLAKTSSVEVSLDITPNPSSGYVRIAAQNLEKAVQLSVVNTLGSTVRVETLLPDSALELNLSDLPSGLYFFQINGLEKSFAPVRWVKM